MIDKITVILMCGMFCMCLPARAQKFSMGGGATFKKGLPFFNVEAGIWQVLNTRWNVNAGLKARVLEDEAKEGEAFFTRVLYTPYIKLGYSLVPDEQLFFYEVFITVEGFPEAGLSVYCRVVKHSNVLVALQPRLSFDYNRITTGAYLQLTMGI